MQARRTLSVLVTLTAGLGLAALGSGPAQADTHVTRDAAHDVATTGMDADSPPDQVVPTRREGDARSLRVTHGPHRVRVLLRYDQLTRIRSGSAVHAFAFRTDSGRRADLDLLVRPGRWQGERGWWVGDRERHCAGLTTKIDYDRDAVRVVVPRRCLGSPRWVRVGGGDGYLVGQRLYADDVSVQGKVGQEVALGPVVRR